jgi:hypothetical protein
MKKVLPVAAILLVVAAAFYFFLHQPEKPQPATGESPIQVFPAAGPAEKRPAPSGIAEAPSAPPMPAGPETQSSNLAARAGVVTPPSTVVAPGLSPVMVVGNVSHALHDYNAVFGGNPVGTNPEITSALSGNNPKHLNFIKPELGMNINGQGELVDSWGTPLFFHQLSSPDTEVRSAGKDKIMWTEDDVVSR